MPRVIFVNRYFFPDHSATSQILSDLAFHLSSRGWNVTVVASRQRYDDPDANLASHELVRSVDVQRIWTTRFGRSNLLLRSIDYLTFYLSSFFALGRMVTPGDVVVAMTDPPLISMVAARVAARKRARLVNWVQDLFPEVAERLGTLRRGLFTGILRRARNRTLRRATMNVVIGRSMQELLLPLEVPVHVRENWADGAAIRPRQRENHPLRREWSLGAAFLVAYSGNLGRAHDFQTILDAAMELRDEPGIRFLIIGAGPQLAAVQSFLETRKLQNVSLYPYQPRERLGDTLSVADVHLISLNPSVEGLIVPSKFYGIAAAGRPSIYVGDPAGEVARILKEFECGIAVAAGDADTLASVIRSLAGDPQRAAAMGRNARELFNRAYDAPRALQDWEQLLGSVAATS